MASAAGSLAGVALILASSQRAFEDVVPFLVLAACALLAAQPAVARWLGGRAGARARPGIGALAGQTLVAAYGGYFSAALGVAVLSVLGHFFDDTLQRLNALKALLQLVIGAVSAVGYALVTPVDWVAVAIIVPAGVVGGEVGAPRAAGERSGAAFGDRRLRDRRRRLALRALKRGSITASATAEYRKSATERLSEVSYLPRSLVRGEAPAGRIAAGYREPGHLRTTVHEYV